MIAQCRKFHSLKRIHDLPSIDEFLTAHAKIWTNRRNMKGYFTTDKHTIDLAKAILKNEKFSESIFNPPSYSSKQDLYSIRVRIADIRDFPQCKDMYDKEKGKEVLVCVGGPSAEDQIVLSNIISSIRQRLDQKIYITRSYSESNVSHSAKQSHARHSSAVNADESLAGHALLVLLMKRLAFGSTEQEVLDPDYIKIDVKLSWNLTVLGIYVLNELNWLKQEYRIRWGRLSEHDINRMASTLSQEIGKIVENVAKIKIFGWSSNSSKSTAFHVSFTEGNSKSVEHENELFRRAGIHAEKLTSTEVHDFFGDSQVRDVWRYPGDTHCLFDLHETNREFSQECGVPWFENKQVSTILVSQNEAGNARVAGVLTSCGQYFYADKLHFSGGYKVHYEYDKSSRSRFKSPSMIRNMLNRIEDILGFENPLSNDLTTATGVSINAIFRMNDRIRHVLDKYGSFGEIATTNSHWTLIASNDEFALVRMTGGGNTGSEEYCPAYFLNIIANTRRIFDSELIGILSTYGCSRAVNAKNSTEFAVFAEGGVISYGKGGAGNTKRHFEAVTAMSMCGLEAEVIEYFNSFSIPRGQRLGVELKNIFELYNVDHAYYNIKRTNRRMGYDTSLSSGEVLALLSMFSASSITFILFLQFFTTI